MTRTKSVYLALIAVLLSPMAANADSIVVSSTVGDYNVTTIDGLIDDVLPTLMQQVWWDDTALATEFADLVGMSLGPNVATTDFGPMFAVTINDGALWYVPIDAATTYFGAENNPNVFTWAVAQSVPEPGTLALLGLGLAGMGLLRHRRKI